MDFVEELSNLADRVEQQADSLNTEEATKHSLILPFIRALGYDVFDATEVIPEYTADVGTKKGEKVDYAIKKDGRIVLLVECKTAGATLSRDHASQLYRYFTTTHDSRIAMLTNGVRYEFYSDLEKDNVMDERPFLQVDMRDLNQAAIQELREIRKPQFDLDDMLSRASDLKYSNEFKKVLDKQFEDPDDGLVRFFAKKVYDGRLTKKRREEFKEILQGAMNEYVSERISRRLTTAAAQEQQSIMSAHSGTDEHGDDGGEAEEQPEDGIVTTEEERDGYRTVKAIMSQVCDPARIAMRDAKSYCAILFDDNNRQPICRFYFDYKTTMKVGFFDADKNETKVEIDGVDDLYNHAEELQATAFFYDQDLQEEPEPAVGEV